MEYIILIKTKTFVDKFIEKEIQSIVNLNVKTIQKGLYQISVKSQEDLFEFTYKFVYYSRLIENIVLKICEFKSLDLVNLNDNLNNNNFDFLKKKLRFKVDSKYLDKFDHLEANKMLGQKILECFKNFNVNLEDPQIIFLPISTEKTNFLTIDLVGFKLTKRDYKLNNNTSSINPIIPNYLFYILGLENQKKEYTIIDSNSDLGDIIIEASLYHPRKALNVKNRYEIAVKNLFDFMPKMPKNIEDKNKYIAIVQNNKTFKHLKENINYSSQKIKISQFEQDWLDVKFHKGEVDFIVSNFSNYKDKEDFEHFQKEFFYQAEFICKKYIGIISKREINNQYLKKNKLDIKYFEQIFIGEQKFYIYVVGHSILLKRRIIDKNRRD